MKKIIFLLILILSFAFINTGCVERKLIVRSTPPGAKVYFDGKYKGETPVDFEFDWYWKHRVELEKKGYNKIDNLEDIKAPPYMWIPGDLLIELLPFKVKDHHNLEYNLIPLKEGESEQLREEFIIEKDNNHEDHHKEQ